MFRVPQFQGNHRLRNPVGTDLLAIWVPAFIQSVRVIVDDHRQQAGSYKGPCPREMEGQRKKIRHFSEQQLGDFFGNVMSSG